MKCIITNCKTEVEDLYREEWYGLCNAHALQAEKDWKEHKKTKVE